MKAARVVSSYASPYVKTCKRNHSSASVSQYRLLFAAGLGSPKGHDGWPAPFRAPVPSGTRPGRGGGLAGGAVRAATVPRDTGSGVRSTGPGRCARKIAQRGSLLSSLGS